MRIGHRRWDCPAQRMYSANVICRLCGGGKYPRLTNYWLVLIDSLAGHMARDCRGRGDPNLAQNKQTAFDSEYSALMAELGEGGGGGGRPAGVVTAGPVAAAPEPEQRIPPWRLPENWMPSMFILISDPGRAKFSPDQRPGGAMAPPHPGFQQPYTQNAGYGYGGYKPEAGYPVAAAPGAADPYAA